MAEPPVVVLLAGGQARRMGGGDKGLLRLGDRTVLDHSIARLAGQAGMLLLNANGDPARFAAFGLPVIADTVAGRPGPLAGILAALEWARRERPDALGVVTAPADAPFVPTDLVERLGAARARSDARIALAASGGRTHPTVGLWPLSLAEDLRATLAIDGDRAVIRWARRYRCAVAEWSCDPIDPFFNINLPTDLLAAERALGHTTAPTIMAAQDAAEGR